MYAMETIKLGVFLTPDIHRRLKVAAANENLSMTKKAEALIIEAVGKKTKKSIAQVAQ